MTAIKSKSCWHRDTTSDITIIGFQAKVRPLSQEMQLYPSCSMKCSDLQRTNKASPIFSIISMRSDNDGDITRYGDRIVGNFKHRAVLDYDGTDWDDHGGTDWDVHDGTDWDVHDGTVSFEWGFMHSWCDKRHWNPGTLCGWKRTSLSIPSLS